MPFLPFHTSKTIWNLNLTWQNVFIFYPNLLVETLAIDCGNGSYPCLTTKENFASTCNRHLHAKKYCDLETCNFNDSCWHSWPKYLKFWRYYCMQWKKTQSKCNLSKCWKNNLLRCWIRLLVTKGSNEHVNPFKCEKNGQVSKQNFRDEGNLNSRLTPLILHSLHNLNKYLLSTFHTF